jgi:hypothetical protein
MSAAATSVTTKHMTPEMVHDCIANGKTAASLIFSGQSVSKTNVKNSKVMRISRQLVQNVVGETQLKSAEYFNSLSSMIRNDLRFTRETKFRIATVKSEFDKKKTPFTSRHGHFRK